MTAARLRLWLAAVALLLGLGAAVVRTPAPAHPGAAAVQPIYKPPSGC